MSPSNRDPGNVTYAIVQNNRGIKLQVPNEKNDTNSLEDKSDVDVGTNVINKIPL